MSKKRWFELHPDLAIIAGRKGGKKSSRKGIKNGEGRRNQNPTTKSRKA